ncbi:recombinase family protein [Peribacillus frigoritolerans]|nr:recombinase family protein [Peribacillus frigoritolerans]
MIRSILYRNSLTQYGCSKIFCDKLSGAKRQLPGLEEALQYAREGDIIVVWRLDRLGCNMQDMIKIVNSLNERGVGFHSLQENLTMDKTNGNMDTIIQFGESGSFNQADEGRFTGVYYFNIEEIRPFMESQGFESLELIGSNAGAILTDENWSYWIDKGGQEVDKIIKLEKASDPNTLGISSHLLYIGRKKG